MEGDTNDNNDKEKCSICGIIPRLLRLTRYIVWDSESMKIICFRCYQITHPIENIDRESN